MVQEPVLKIDKPHFVVTLHKDTIEVDIKEGAKKRLESVVEAHPILRESLGVLFQTVIPLDVALRDIESAEVDDEGRLKIKIPLRKDIVIPLEVNESKRLVKKLNELIPLAKQKTALKCASCGHIIDTEYIVFRGLITRCPKCRSEDLRRHFLE